MFLTKISLDVDDVPLVERRPESTDTLGHTFDRVTDPSPPSRPGSGPCVCCLPF